jgi:hypothetical protein
MKPFHIPPQPTAPTTKSAEPSPVPAPGTKVANARDTGNPLPTPSNLDARQHGHSTEIPWGPAGGPDDRKSPMKFGK